MRYKWAKIADACFSDLVGKTITAIRHDRVAMDGAEYNYVDSDEITIECDYEKWYQMRHHQECCEEVYVEDVCGGDLKDIIGEKILKAECVRNWGQEPDKGELVCGTLWTFYKISTNKTSLTIRWVGTSNGYYSVDVDFYEVDCDP